MTGNQPSTASRGVSLDSLALVVVLATVLLSLLLAACLPGCQQLPPVCEPAAARCAGPDRVEICTPEGQWMLADHCSDFGPGEWECASADGGVVACYPKTITDPR